MKRPEDPFPRVCESVTYGKSRNVMISTVTCDPETIDPGSMPGSPGHTPNHKIFIFGNTLHFVSNQLNRQSNDKKSCQMSVSEWNPNSQTQKKLDAEP